MCDVLDKMENRGESKTALLMKKLFDQNVLKMQSGLLKTRSTVLG